jgi:outer membrane protein TolC
MRAVFCCIAVSLLNMGAMAQDHSSGPIPVLSLERAGITGEPVELTLQDAILLVLNSNKDIEASRLDIQAANLNSKLASSVYDPTLTFDSHYEKKATPVSSILGGSLDGRLDETEFDATATLSGLLPWGGASYQASSSNSRQTSDNLFIPLNPQFYVNLNVSVTQPLLRGRSIDEARSRIQISAKNKTVSDEAFAQHVLETVSQTSKAYFDLLSALEGLAIQEEAFRQAQRAVESNQRLAAQGLLPAIDVVASEAQVKTFETAYLSAQETVTIAENSLKLLMLPGRDSPVWSKALHPVSQIDADPERLVAIEIPVEKAVAEALAKRPEISHVKTLASINEIDRRLLRDQTHPQLDLYGSYTSTGLAGTLVVRPPDPLFPITLNVPPVLLGGVSDALLNSLYQRDPTFRVGLRLSVPIRNRAAEANLGLAQVDVRRIRNQTEQVEQAVEVEVRNGIQGLRSAEARFRAAQAARTYAERDYESDKRKVTAGLQTVFVMLQRQTDLVQAKGRELQAKTDLRKAVIELERAMGRTLEVYHIDLAKVRGSGNARPSAPH